MGAIKNDKFDIQFIERTKKSLKLTMVLTTLPYF
jgi:hypothetical protein